jgi:hypothetical protein
VTGSSLCNPNGIAWSHFYSIITDQASSSSGSGGGGSVSVSSSGMLSSATRGSLTDDADPSSSALDLSSWCYPGHTGRLCAQCSVGYFSSGRWCLRCMSESVHVLIVAANLLVLLFLVAYLYVKSPGAATSAKSLRVYQHQAARASDAVDAHQRQQQQRQSPHSSPPSASASPSTAPASVALHRLSGGGESSHRSASAAALSHADSPDSHSLAVGDNLGSPAAEALPSSSSSPSLSSPTQANPLKLLVFHMQQLSLLLQTTAALPAVMTGLLSAVSSSSNGFSLSSLVAMECLNRAWSLEHRCWLAVVAPLLVGLFALTILLLDRARGGDRRSSGSSSSSSSGDGKNSSREEPLLLGGHGSEEEEAVAAGSASVQWRSFVARCYGVCGSVLYLLVFPCAQTALSALSCTDLRESSSSRVYLNLYPWQQCDDEWRRSILPPALIGVLFWFVFFPLCSTVLLQRASAAATAGPISPAAAASLWPLCSDLLDPYSPRYWYWEQVLLVRRLSLVAAVALIPASSLYLPLALFSLVQLAALIQHWSHPFSHSALNVGELASLYLLLLIYISALILQTGVSEGGFQATANGWAILLFALNLIFILTLLAGLFGVVRVHGAALFDSLRRWLELRGWLSRGDKPAQSSPSA